MLRMTARTVAYIVVAFTTDKFAKSLGSYILLIFKALQNR